jgi:hypothetical protein
MTDSPSVKSSGSSRLSRRYLVGSLILLVLVFEAANIGLVLWLRFPSAFDYARVVMSSGIDRDPKTDWPSSLPDGEQWARPTKSTIYRKFGRRAYVFEATDDHAYSDPPSNETTYMMTIMRGGFPLAAGELKRCTVWQDGEIIRAVPSDTMQQSWMPLGLILNPLIFAVPTWVAVGLLARSIKNRRKNDKPKPPVETRVRAPSRSQGG